VLTVSPQPADCAATSTNLNKARWRCLPHSQTGEIRQRGIVTAAVDPDRSQLGTTDGPAQVRSSGRPSVATLGRPQPAFGLARSERRLLLSGALRPRTTPILKGSKWSRLKKFEGHKDTLKFRSLLPPRARKISKNSRSAPPYGISGRVFASPRSISCPQPALTRQLRVLVRTV
jgi:hypothetical protein